MQLILNFTSLSFYNVTTRLADLVGLDKLSTNEKPRSMVRPMRSLWWVGGVGGLGVIIESNLNRARLSCCWVGVGLGCDNMKMLASL